MYLLGTILIIILVVAIAVFAAAVSGRVSGLLFAPRRRVLGHHRLLATNVSRDRQSLGGFDARLETLVHSRPRGLAQAADRPGAKPVSASTDCTRPARSALRNWTGDRLTPTCNGLGHEAASVQAWRSVHSPISAIMPLCSASGMKVLGGTSPRVG